MHYRRAVFVLVATLALLGPTSAVLAQANSDPKPHSVELVVTASGQYILAGKPIAQSRLREELRALKYRHREVDLRVVAGPRATYQQIAPVMQAVQQEGLTKLAFVTSPPQSPSNASQPGTR